MSELKAYRNISVKIAVIAGALSMAINYTCSIINKDAVSIEITETLYQSFLVSLVFALIGYCCGSVSGAHLQRKRLSDIKKKRADRKRYIEEQIAIRQAKLQVI